MAASHKLIVVNSEWGSNGDPYEYEDCDCELGKDHY